MIAYHGTNAKFDEFNTDFFERGDYGWGCYFTRTKDLAADYGKILKCEIPDDEYFMDQDDSFDYQPQYIQDCLTSILGDLDEEDADKLAEVIDRSYCNGGFWIYDTLTQIKNGIIPACLYMREHGIKGMYSFKGDCFIVFSGEDIKILERLEESDKIFYHGSNSKFTKFDKSKIKENKLGLCFNFTDDYSIAYQYGDNILKCKLELNNPLTIEYWDKKFPYKYFNLLGKKFGAKDYNKEEYEKDPETYGSMFKQFKHTKQFIEVLQEMGFDGVSFPEDHHYGVFNPEQITILNEFSELNEMLEGFLN